MSHLETRLPAAPNVAAPAAGLAGAILLTVAVGAVVSPRTFWAFIVGAAALGPADILIEMLARGGPLMLTGLAAALAFRAGLFNFGAEGQLIAGMLAAIGLDAAKIAPGPFALPAMLVAGMLAGATMMGLAAGLKVKRRIDEAILTLLMNVIALLCLELFTPSAAGANGPDMATPLRAGIGCAIGVAACALFYAVLRYTILGFEMRATGGNPAAARFAGIRAGRMMVGSGLASGALAGFAGAAMQGGIIASSSGASGGGFGYAGIVVAVLAASEPRALAPAALAVGALTALIGAASRSAGVDAWLGDIVLGLAVVLTLAFRRIAPAMVRP